MSRPIICAVTGCPNEAIRYPSGRGWCPKHYARWYRHGDPLHAKGSHDLDERLEGQFNKTESCWLWTGTINSQGYGVTIVKGRQIRVHRLMYEKHVGPIPEGLTLDHLCRVRHCGRPDHLEAVTIGENIRRSPIMTSPEQAKNFTKGRDDG